MEGFTASEQEEMVALAASQEKSFYRNLTRNRNKIFAIHSIRALQDQIDALADHVRRRPDSHFDCRPGCSYCCTIRVETIAPEVFLIARHLNALPHLAQVELIAKLATHAEAARGVRKKDYFLQCPLLDNEQCSIYQARPTMCRKFLSIDVEKCKKFDPLFPEDSEMVRKSAAMIYGTAQAYARAKLPNQYVEFGQALLLALTDPTAEDRWYRGEQVFEPVPEEMDDEQQRRT